MKTTVTSRPDGLWDVQRDHGETGDRLLGLTWSQVTDAAGDRTETAIAGVALQTLDDRSRETVQWCRRKLWDLVADYDSAEDAKDYADQARDVAIDVIKKLDDVILRSGEVSTAIDRIARDHEGLIQDLAEDRSAEATPRNHSIKSSDDSTCTHDNIVRNKMGEMRCAECRAPVVEDPACGHGYAHWGQCPMCNSAGYACTPSVDRPNEAQAQCSSCGVRAASVCLGCIVDVQQAERCRERAIPTEIDSPLPETTALVMASLFRRGMGCNEAFLDQAELKDAGRFTVEMMLVLGEGVEIKLVDRLAKVKPEGER